MQYVLKSNFKNYFRVVKSDSVSTITEHNFLFRYIYIVFYLIQLNNFYLTDLYLTVIYIKWFKNHIT